VKKETEDAFTELFREREQKLQRIDERRQEAEAKAQAFRRAFREHAERVMRPAFEELRRLLGDTGSIETDVSESSDPDGSLSTISFCVFTGDRRLSDSRPDSSDATVRLEFSCKAHSQKVSVYQAHPIHDGKSSGPAGEMALEQITAEFIQDRVLQLMQKMVT
jgi:hypothetical protein